METTHVTLDRDEAARLYRKYKEHAAYSAPIDWEIQRAYQLLAKGKLVIRALESIKSAGLNREFLPKLAIAPATAERCFMTRTRDGAVTFDVTRWGSRSAKQRTVFREEAFVFPVESFPIATWDPERRRRENASTHEAMVPIIPLHLRPKRGLANYHILWEAEWRRVVPKDPLLLRRIGRADLWLVVAAWELTEVEQAALATRVTA